MGGDQGGMEKFLIYDKNFYTKNFINIWDF